MAKFLFQSDPGFEQAFDAFLATKREVSEDVDAAVRDILRKVRMEGDAALQAYSKTFDRIDFNDTPLAVTPEEIAKAVAESDPDTVAALSLAGRWKKTLA